MTWARGSGWGLILALGMAAACSKAPVPQEKRENFRLPADHEPIQELVLAWEPGFSSTLIQLLQISTTKHNATVVVDPALGLASVRAELEQSRVIDLDRVSLIEHPVEAAWVRDYGPITAIGDQGSQVLLDFGYEFRPDADRLNQHLAASRWPGMRLVTVDAQLDGGNLISDGAGMCVTAENPSLNGDDLRINEALRSYAGCNQIIEVPPLIDEPTGHVDMFMYTNGPHSFVVGDYTVEDDPINKYRLDEVASILRESGARVARLPMPHRAGDYFPSYANLLVLDSAVVVPTYPDIDDPAVPLRLISRSFPGREILAIDASELLEYEGALHCLAQTIPGAHSGQL